MASRLFEEITGGPANDRAVQRNIKSQRGSRLTLDHLLKLRRNREIKRLRKLKDLKLYNIMYNSDDEGGGGF